MIYLLQLLQNLSCYVPILLYKSLIKVEFDRNKIIEAFYEIPSDYINKLTERCLNYIEKYSKPKEAGEENESEYSEEEELEIKELTSNI